MSRPPSGLPRPWIPLALALMTLGQAGLAQAQEAVVPAAPPPLPAQLFAASVEVASVSDQPGSFAVHPRLALSDRHMAKWPGFFGGDLILAPLTGADSWAQGLIGLGSRRAYVHPYGGLASTATVYRDTLSLGEAPRGMADPLQAYEVVEGGAHSGWAVDVRGLGVVAGPRVVYSPSSADAPFSVGAYAGIQGFYQQAPGWVDAPKSAGQHLRPESTFVGDLGVLYLNQDLWVELSLAMTGGQRFVGFADRHLYGRLTARISRDTLAFSLGLGAARSVNPGMAVLPLQPPGSLEPSAPRVGPSDGDPAPTRPPPRTPAG